MNDAEKYGDVTPGDLNDDFSCLNGTLAATPPHDGDTKQNTQRSNTTVQVCWHRSTSVGIDDFMTASEVPVLTTLLFLWQTFSHFLQVLIVIKL